MASKFGFQFSTHRSAGAGAGQATGCQAGPALRLGGGWSPTEEPVGTVPLPSLSGRPACRLRCPWLSLQRDVSSGMCALRPISPPGLGC